MNDRLFIAYRIILFLHGETVHVLLNDQTHRRFRILAYLRQYQRSLTLYQGGKRRNGHRNAVPLAVPEVGSVDSQSLSGSVASYSTSSFQSFADCKEIVLLPPAVDITSVSST